MINDRHCFECYGYDILIDADLKPWLVEVNASPSLSTTTETDRIMKLNLLKDIYNIVVPPEIYNGNLMSGEVKPLASGETKPPCQPCGAFYVLYDEAAEAAEAAGDDVDDERQGRGRGSRASGKNKTEWR